MLKIKSKIILLVLLSFASSNLLSENYLLHVGAMIDVEKLKVIKKQSIRVSDGKIIEIKSGFIDKNETETLIDLKSQTIMPGLMDMHVHLSGEINKTSYTEKFFMNPTDVAYRSTVFAEKTLMAGFTTVRDLGDLTKGIGVSLRKAIEKRLY